MSARLKELAQLRSEGKTRASSLKFDEDEAEFYEELDDGQYRQHQRDRLREHDFVVDDDGEGYVDNGQYEWDSRQQYDDSGSDEERGPEPKRLKLAKANRPQNADISSLFRQAQTPANGTSSRPKESVKELEDLISNVGTLSKRSSKSTDSGRGGTLGSLGSLGSLRSRSSKGISGGRSLGSGLGSGFRSSGLGSGIGLGLGAGIGRSGSIATTPTPSRSGSRGNVSFPAQPRLEAPDESMEANEMVSDNATAESPRNSEQANERQNGEVSIGSLQPEVEDPMGQRLDSEEVPSSPPPPPVQPQVLQTPTPAASEDDGLAYAAGANLIADNSVDISSEGPRESFSGDTLRLFWVDYKEIAGSHSLMLFGRTADGRSAAVNVKNVPKDVYLLPRVGKTVQDVRTELSEVLNGTAFRCMPVTKKYCFASTEIPREAEYLKVQIPYSSHIFPQGKTWSHGFGTNTALFESLVLQKNIMGPCWLDVEHYELMSNATTTQIQAQCDNPKFLKVADCDEDMPPLTVASLSIRTQFVGNRHEVVAVSCRVFRNVNVANAVDSAQELPQSVWTGVRPLEGVMSPGWRAAMDQHNASTKTKTLFEHRNERSLLSWVAAKLRGADPDVLIGHGLTQVHLEILLQRMLDLGERSWSHLGRLRQPGMHHKSAQAIGVLNACAGRLVCDLNNTMGQELAAGRCSEFTLDEMVREFLGKTRISADTNVAGTPWTRDGAAGLLRIAQHNALDTLYAADLAMRLQMLPLTRQLTNLAGNAWARTLAGTRSGRNDFLLLHEFDKAGFILPDRRDKTEGGSVTEKGAKYQGGAVFEPEKGLYRSNVLVMDFNSLYPSLIQEYNICFSTIDLSKFNEEDGEEMPQLPGSEVPQGILPRVIQALVERRRAVKGLMKGAKDDRQRADYDIRQQALKLTANSMYGCLGLANSRFAARPLAMLVTSKGRETLHRTRELAESQNLRVLYGDTDSVMIYTGVTDYDETRRIGTAFKKQVNDQYRKMELDIDNVFSSILLYAKKKYAAMNVVVNPDGTRTSELQVKGLDLRRREYCQLCKDASLQVLELLFDAKDDDDAEEDVFTTKVLPYLRKLREDMLEAKTPLGKYVIRNQLSRDPRTYKDQRLPQLTVANARIASGDVVRAKDVLSYIISAGEGPAYERAVTVSNLRARNLQPDIGYYLDHQLFAPLERLCMFVPGFDAVRLGEALGLEKKRSSSSSGSSSGIDPLQALVQPLETTLTDAERFSSCNPLLLRGSCGHEFAFTGLADPQLSAKGLSCPECSAKLAWSLVAAQVDSSIRHHIRRYYDGWLVCQDSDCRLRTRQISGYGRRCPRTRCPGQLAPMYSDKMLYTQLTYYAALFDAERATEPRIKQVAHLNESGLARAQSSANKYLEQCGRRYVDMGAIFATTKPVKVQTR